MEKEYRFVKALAQRPHAARVIGALLIAALAVGPTMRLARTALAPLSDLGASPASAEGTLRDHTLHTLDGRTLTLGSLAGEVVVVNFWASWCAPCRKELPRLGRLEASLADSKVRVVAVSIDEDAENARRFCRANNIRLTVAHDGPDGLARELDLKHVPYTLVLDRTGKVAYTTSGSDDKALRGVAKAAEQLAAAPAPGVDVRAGDAR